MESLVGAAILEIGKHVDQTPRLAVKHLRRIGCGAALGFKTIVSSWRTRWPPVGGATALGCSASRYTVVISSLL